ncbi:flagellar basal body-associated protein FliL [Cellulomonas sp. URHE0023]|uniref:flagellar basal body-associated FliL family protein n=1 Tax=Cellulomonas sp. URHE0023 TaxID=1380354 RepID=UPI000484968F|nr:flagellar basal body-associated FliL family protein [Cellulomonas sp. URHE0023]
MPIEQRVVSGSKIGGGNKIGGGASASREAEAESPKATKVKKPKKKLLIIGLATVLAVGGGGGYFFLSKGGAPEAEPAPEKGAVITIEPVSLNLAEGHYLRLGLGLQLTKEVTSEEVPDTAEALDLAIAQFSGHTVAEVTDPATRDALKAQLLAALGTAYDGKVMDVYLTNYVTQ